MEILWPLRTWIRHIIERQKTPEFTVEKALAKDAAEREVALSLRRPLAEEHWARVEEGLFAVRSRMMAKVPYNLTIADLWEYNIDLDADAYPFIAICPLAMSGRDEYNNDFFELIRAPARLDENGAYKRAVAIENLAGTWNSDLDFEAFDVKGDGTV